MDTFNGAFNEQQEQQGVQAMIDRIDEMIRAEEEERERKDRESVEKTRLEYEQARTIQHDAIITALRDIAQTLPVRTVIDASVIKTIIEFIQPITIIPYDRLTHVAPERTSYGVHSKYVNWVVSYKELYDTTLQIMKIIRTKDIERQKYERERQSLLEQDAKWRERIESIRKENEYTWPDGYTLTLYQWHWPCGNDVVKVWTNIATPNTTNDGEFFILYDLVHDEEIRMHKGNGLYAIRYDVQSVEQLPFELKEWHHITIHGVHQTLMDDQPIFIDNDEDYYTVKLLYPVKTVRELLKTKKGGK